VDRTLPDDTKHKDFMIKDKDLRDKRYQPLLDFHLLSRIGAVHLFVRLPVCLFVCLSPKCQKHDFLKN